MKLYHVSEESDIKVFNPRTPLRDDLDKSIPLVWALCEKALPNFLTPRDCPRIVYRIDDMTTEEDMKMFFSSDKHNRAIIIENGWYEKMKNTPLYIYEFSPENFITQDGASGYYVSHKTEKPIGKRMVNDLFKELIKRNFEIRMVDNLWSMADKVEKSTLNWSICDIANAKKE